MTCIYKCPALPFLSSLQSGALDLLKELRTIPMTLELLQVSLLIPTEDLSSTQAALKP